MSDYIPEPPQDQPSDSPQPTVDQWPHVQPVRGQAYGFKCPNTGAYMVAMSIESWQDHTNAVNALREAKQGLEHDLKQLRDYTRRLRSGLAVTPGGVIVPDKNPREPS